MLLERRCSRATDVLVLLAERPPGRADLAKRRAITLQAGSHKGGPATRFGPLLAIAADPAHETDFADALAGRRGQRGSPRVRRQYAPPPRARAPGPGGGPGEPRVPGAGCRVD